MVEAGRPGAIINVLSILAFGSVAGGLGIYAASKAGLLQLTRTMAMELARHRVRVNAIAPGYVLTEMNREYFASEAGQVMTKRIPQRRIGDPSELDGALLLLASDASSYMTGSTIVIDGGTSRVEPLSPVAGRRERCPAAWTRLGGFGTSRRLGRRWSRPVRSTLSLR